MLLLLPLYSAADVLPFPEDTIAYNDRFNNRQWVAFDEEGFLHITYTGQYGTAGHTRDIYYVTNLDGEFVTTQVTDTGVDNNYSSFVIDSGGNIHMVYIQRDASDMFQLVYQNNVGGGFSDPVWITSGSNKATPHIAIGPDGVLHFAFYEFNASPPSHAFYTTYDPANGTTGPVVQLNHVHSPPSGENDIRVVVDSDNVAHIVLREGGSFGGDLRYYNNSSGVMEEESTPVTDAMEYPAMAIDHEDMLHIIYRRNSDKRIAYFTRDNNGVYSNVVAATPPNIGNPAFYRTVGVDDTGRFYFGYQNSQVAAPVGFFLVSGIDGVFEEPVLVWDDPEDLYLLRNSSSVAARGDGEIAFFYAPSASRDGDIVCDIFMKKGLLFADEEPIIEVSPTALDFGPTETGESTEMHLTIYNQGPVTLNLLDLHFSNEAFYSPTDGPMWVEPYSNILLPVTFAPEEEGHFSESLTIVSDAANAPQITIDLFGEGVHYYAAIDVTESVQFYDVTVHTTAEGAAGGFSDGNMDLVIHQVAIEGSDAAVFDFEADLPITIPPGEQWHIPVWFTPDAAGEFNASLVIHSNAENCNPCSIWLFGEGVADETSVHAAATEELSIFPNPASRLLNIQSNQQLGDIRLIDMLGQLVYYQSEMGSLHTIDVSGLHPGLYFLQLTAGGQLETFRIQVTGNR